ncbi:MAG: hypothetical protein JNK48_11805 [Bryobacterales bacterium]|nr:hypothetical protein [Bryobacterales bacterium]
MRHEAIGRCLTAAVLAVAPLSLMAQGQGVGPARPFSFAAIGDAPYEPVVGGRQQYPVPAYEALIAKINSDADVAFSVHIGDIKAGNTLCENVVYSQNLAYFNSFAKPLIFTPGDNEWTDCHRANNGNMDPLDRLQLIRDTFYPHNKSLGQTTIPLFKDKQPYVENSVWTEKPAMFIALHMPGSNNNRDRRTGTWVDATDAEYTARNASNMAFLDDQLKKATLDPQIKLVVIAAQANPFDRFLESGQGYTVSGYGDFIAKIRAWVEANPSKRMLYIHGDTHTARFEPKLTPVYPSATQLTPAGTPYPNFARLEVYAQTAAFANWFKVSVNPDGTYAVTVVPAP